MSDNEPIAVVTGGEGELAQCISSALRSAGMAVKCPGRADLDVTDAEAVYSYFKRIENVDLLVCNAGMTDDGLLLKMDESSWDGVMAVNLRGAFLTARSAVKLMMKKKIGHIILISSHSAYHPPVGQANYAAAKAGLEGLAKSMAAELGGRNIRVNVIVPGYMETKMTADLSTSVKVSALEKHCLKRYNEPLAVASFIRNLHTEMLHTSGQVFHLDSRIV